MYLLSVFSDLPNWIIAAATMATAWVAWHFGKKNDLLTNVLAELAKQNKIFQESLELEKHSTLRLRRPLFEKDRQDFFSQNAFRFTIINTGQIAFRISIIPNTIQVSSDEIVRKGESCQFTLQSNQFASLTDVSQAGDINYIDGQGINYSQPFTIVSGLFSIFPGGVRREP